MKNCVVIGGGVIGLFSAYYLAKSGNKVTVLEAGNFDDGCSYGNAGMIVPSHIIPLAQPGMIAQGIRWMFNSRSPFYVKPRLSKELFSWGWKFYKNANKEHVDSSKVPLRDLALFSKDLYQDIHSQNASFDLMHDGLLMLFQTDKVAHEEIELANTAQSLGLQAKVLNYQEIPQIEQNTKVTAIGGVHYKSDAHLDPNKLMNFLKEELVKMNVELRSGIKIKYFKQDRGRAQACIDQTGNEYHADEFVISAGSWSVNLAQQLKVKFKMLPGKGYSFNVPKKLNSPSIPSILCEGKVAVTPFQDRIRFGGTMEISTLSDRNINMNRVEGIVETIRNFYPDFSFDPPMKDQVWYGFRPCTPSGLPFIGKHPDIENVTFSTGHAMMGLSLAPASGKLVEEIIMDKTHSINADKFKSLN